MGQVITVAAYETLVIKLARADPGAVKMQVTPAILSCDLQETSCAVQSPYLGKVWPCDSTCFMTDECCPHKGHQTLYIVQCFPGWKTLLHQPIRVYVQKSGCPMLRLGRRITTVYTTIVLSSENPIQNIISQHVLETEGTVWATAPEDLASETGFPPMITPKGTCLL